MPMGRAGEAGRGCDASGPRVGAGSGRGALHARDDERGINEVRGNASAGRLRHSGVPEPLLSAIECDGRLGSGRLRGSAAASGLARKPRVDLDLDYGD